MYYICLLILLRHFINAEETLGCGGFIISHVEIDYTKIEIELYTKDGAWKDKTNCAPSSGYYFIPIYDNGDYVLQLVPPAGWSLTPTIVHVSVNGVSDLCSVGEDINFIFQGFGITGIVESYGTSKMGPEGVTVELQSDMEVRRTTTKQNGTFFFTPVYPGEYTLLISHEVWRILKPSMSVNVKEGNTEIQPSSLVVAGYDVTGYVKLDGQPVEGIDLVLFYDQDNEHIPHVDGCRKTIIRDLKRKGKQLCHISSSVRGNFTFDVVSPGHYFIIPYYKGPHINFEPQYIEFVVYHDSLQLSQTFNIVGFSVFGYVRSSKNGKPLIGANVFLNGKKVTTTKLDGSYKLENLKAESYTIYVTFDNMFFDSIEVKVNQNVIQIPDFAPALYRICGKVLSDQTHDVLISQSGSKQTFVSHTAVADGTFCINLNIGKYSIQVILNEDEELQGLQFFPIMHEFQITDGPILGIVFSQLKATVVGKVICSNKEDCIGLNVILKLFINNNAIEDKIKTVTLLDNDTYVFENVSQGTYEVSLESNKFCWKKLTHSLIVNSITEMVPSFVQTGYLVVFVSSHSSRVTYKLNQEDKSLEIEKGKTSLCLKHPGLYQFTLRSCHKYETNLISHNTDSKEFEIYVTAIKHTVIVEIECEQDYGELYMIVNMDGHKRQEGPLQYRENGYYIRLILQPTDSVILVPHSEVLYVYPPIISIAGQDDCANVGPKFRAKKGRVFVGHVIPPIEGVLITIEMDNSDILTNETDVDGRYRFAPQDEMRQFKMVATKESYILFGPDEQGNFVAHKLAEIVVNVIHRDTNEPLQDFSGRSRAVIQLSELTPCDSEELQFILTQCVL